MKKTKNTTAFRKNDLPDSKKDKESLKPDEAILNLPDVRDIPGQEHIHVPPLGELADTTISSDDEEGTRIFTDEEEVFPGLNISKDEIKVLRDASEKTPGITDDNNLENAKLDDADDDGQLLNERTNVSGSDLDVPGSEEDDANEDTGEEDEENSLYSLSGEVEDNSISKQ